MSECAIVVSIELGTNSIPEEWLLYHGQMACLGQSLTCQFNRKQLASHCRQLTINRNGGGGGATLSEKTKTSRPLKHVCRGNLDAQRNTVESFQRCIRTSLRMWRQSFDNGL